MPATKTKVGDEVRLPSGVSVRVTTAVDAKRPWSLVGVGHVWQIRRHQPDQSGSGWQYFFGTSPVPLQLDEADAAALMKILNQVQPPTR